ncbi:hypothetical protein CEUSTIGMA_g12003.t1 [Chlamydomonas eustigma]|uniref:Cysteine-rich DPF motif domain-containing protein 1 n=1 Tax=Chlamydomonas eustigma TaxID=1157962 RepID=A0A250XNU4_9CHLO|nr:hypothetical protein CEUSTIGMA_g12003.t1 [Chlamydomonas eustigma]|eukprot:GAX84582.1 hypothetical protein CEUSTIGMA_g12003.t1 [Chlamydomonas eustigma]
MSERIFTCYLCSFSAPYSTFGRSLKIDELKKDEHLAGTVMFLEDSYLLPDPNAAQVHPLCLGSHCNVCKRSVCVSEECSLFYSKRFCADCARAHVSAFPLECRKLSPKIFNTTSA